jgi:hypothetical protein
MLLSSMMTVGHQGTHSDQQGLDSTVINLPIFL